MMLDRLSEATRLLAEARTLDDVRAVRDMAEAARAYATAARLGAEAVQHASAIKLDAERRAGEMLAEIGLHKGRSQMSERTTLDGLGLTRDQSSRWQALARLPVSEYAALRDGIGTRTRATATRAVSEAIGAESDRTLEQFAPVAARKGKLTRAVDDIRHATSMIEDTAPHTDMELSELAGAVAYLIAVVDRRSRPQMRRVK
jgi:O6-methylguanine-DNA--protein-cysteine methyltransferase